LTTVVARSDVMAMSAFDPDAAAAPDSGIFGLPHGPDEAAVVIVPVPFDATTSYRPGTADGPRAVLSASRQVDLFDPQLGRPYERGIHLLAEDDAIRTRSEKARALAAPLIAEGGAGAEHAVQVRFIDEAGEAVNEFVRRHAEAILAEGRVPGVLGGDHSVPFGAIAAAAARHPGIGILHVDAHADLRRSFEGFEWSHASIMDNVLRKIPGVARIVQVAIRDLGSAEWETIGTSGGRVICHLDLDWKRREATGERFADLCARAVAALPEQVWISFDIDGLDPALCPNTGTPVPGGLSFTQAVLLLECLADSGRRIVGFDLCEVAGQEWDANVGARLLYKLCGFALLGA
jgi:agmatinase